MLTHPLTTGEPDLRSRLLLARCSLAPVSPILKVSPAPKILRDHRREADIMRQRVFPYLVFAGLVGFLPAACADEVKSPTVDFNRDVRPILSRNCFACHGPDGGARVSKLRLD